jgi:hypothetical protein
MYVYNTYIICIYTCRYLYIYRYIYIYMYVYIYIYIYIYVSIYVVSIYIIYVYICSSAPSVLTCDTCDFFYTLVCLSANKQEKKT